VELAREDILTPFEKLLSHIKKVIRKEVCWCLSNLSACSFSEVQLLINKESLIRKLLDLLTHNETEIQLEIVWIFRNLATVHQPIMYAFMRTYRVVRYIVSLLVSTLEPRLQEAALSALKMLLKLGEQFQENGSNAVLIELKQLGVLPKIEDLQLSDTTAVYELALSILEEFCETVDPLNR
jgi:importin subunit alpha-1